MMTLEYLAEQKAKYQDKANYFKNMEFDNLATDFQNAVDLINNMEEYMKEQANEQSTKN